MTQPIEWRTDRRDGRRYLWKQMIRGHLVTVQDDYEKWPDYPRRWRRAIYVVEGYRTPIEVQGGTCFVEGQSYGRNLRKAVDAVVALG